MILFHPGMGTKTKITEQWPNPENVLITFHIEVLRFRPLAFYNHAGNDAHGMQVAEDIGPLPEEVTTGYPGMVRRQLTVAPLLSERSMTLTRTAVGFAVIEVR